MTHGYMEPRPGVAETVRRSLRILKPSPSPRLRLVCFPYAGAGATIFHGWPHALPPEVEVCAVHLPGRHERLREAPFTNIATIVEHVGDVLSLLPAVPIALYGHSFGAIVAFEMARFLEAQGHSLRALVVGAQRAPHMVSRHEWLHNADDDTLLAALRDRYGAPPSLAWNENLRSLALPPLRADLQALETYAFQSGARVHTRVMVLRGRMDTSVSAEDAVAWEEIGDLPTTHLEVDAGHFFVDSHRSWVLQCVHRALRAEPYP